MVNTKLEAQRQTILHHWLNGTHDAKQIHQKTQIPLRTVQWNLKKLKEGYTKCGSCYRTTYTPKYSHFNTTNSHKNSTNSRYLDFVFCNLATFKKKGISKLCAL